MTATSSPPSPHSLSSDLASRAISSLVAYSAKTQDTNPLAGSSGSELLVNFTLSKVPSKASNKPHRINVPHRPLPSSVSDASDFTVCIIVKDGSKEWVKETLESQGSKFSYVKKVLTLSKLRKDFAQHAHRRDLVRTYTQFLADDRILPMLSKVRGGRRTAGTKRQQHIPHDYNCKNRSDEFETTIQDARAPFSPLRSPILSYNEHLKASCFAPRAYPPRL
jgi:hypothetical protein